MPKLDPSNYEYIFNLSYIFSIKWNQITLNVLYSQVKCGSKFHFLFLIDAQIDCLNLCSSLEWRKNPSSNA